ncbi:MAG: hypothetical protein JST54_35260 [Deltaproteobacteria bacterium]|nr:hypothetical protein [Deltaproteobacteria bacterium]
MNPAKPDSDKPQVDTQEKELGQTHERKLELDLNDPRAEELDVGWPAKMHDKRNLTYEDTDSPRKR